MPQGIIALVATVLGCGLVVAEMENCGRRCAESGSESGSESERGRGRCGVVDDWTQIIPPCSAEPEALRPEHLFTARQDSST